MENSVIIVSFSGRNGGNCEQIADLIFEHTNNRTNVLKYKFNDFTISPCGDCGYECFDLNTACPHIEDAEFELLEKLCSCDCAYFIVPNYCDHPCANFYIFNERSNCYFQQHPQRLEQYLKTPKKFIAVSNSEPESFCQAFVQHTDVEPEMLFVSAKEFGKRSIDGNVLDNAEARNMILRWADLPEYGPK